MAVGQNTLNIGIGDQREQGDDAADGKSCGKAADQRMSIDKFQQIMKNSLRKSTGASHVKKTIAYPVELSAHHDNRAKSVLSSFLYTVVYEVGPL